MEGAVRLHRDQLRRMTTGELRAKSAVTVKLIVVSVEPDILGIRGAQITQEHLNLIDLPAVKLRVREQFTITHHIVYRFGMQDERVLLAELCEVGQVVQILQIDRRIDLGCEWLPLLKHELEVFEYAWQAVDSTALRKARLIEGVDRDLEHI